MFTRLLVIVRVTALAVQRIVSTFSYMWRYSRAMGSSWFDIYITGVQRIVSIFTYMWRYSRVETLQVVHGLIIKRQKQ